MLADIRFSLDDDSAGDSFVGPALENGAEELARNDLGIAIVKIASKDSPPPHCYE